VILPYDGGLMGSNPPPQPPAAPSAPPPVTPSPQLSFADAEAHYRELLTFFKHLVWLTGGALTVVILVAGYLFHSNLQDNLRDVRQDAKGEATRIATEEAEKGVKTVLGETNMNELVQKVAKEGVAEAVTGDMVAQKVGPLADKIIEQRLASQLQPVEQRIVLIGRISECEARIHTGFRSGLEELFSILNSTHDPQVRQFAQSTLVTTAKGYEDYMLGDVQRMAPNKAFDLLKMGVVRPIQPPISTLRDVIGLINKDQDLNVVAMAFLAFRDMTGEHVKMFDLSAVNSWCASHRPTCEQ
jgi:hypothetical protein